MKQTIQFVSGSYDDRTSDYRVFFQKNLEIVVPSIKSTGSNDYYLKPVTGIDVFVETQGLDRGGINWNNRMYRVIGSILYLVKEGGELVSIGDVGNDNKPVSLDYSFDFLIICSSNSLYYYDGTSLNKVTDPDVGPVFDALFLSGYVFATDGKYIANSNISNAYEWNPLDYNSSEADPDPIKKLLRSRTELYAANRYTIEVFDIIQSTEFSPLARIEGAQLQKGCVGTRSICFYQDMLAFVGSGRNESLGVYMGINSQMQKISNYDIDAELNGLSLGEAESIIVENIKHGDQFILYIHLPNKTYIYNYIASLKLNTQCWTELPDYKARFFTQCYNKIYCGNSIDQKLGLLNSNTKTLFNDVVYPEIYLVSLFNNGQGFSLSGVELTGLFARNAEYSASPMVGISLSSDGVNWSEYEYISTGLANNYLAKPAWFMLGYFFNHCFIRFKFDGKSLNTISNVILDLEGSSD